MRPPRRQRPGYNDLPAAVSRNCYGLSLAPPKRCGGSFRFPIGEQRRHVNAEHLAADNSRTGKRSGVYRQPREPGSYSYLRSNHEEHTGPDDAPQNYSNVPTGIADVSWLNWCLWEMILSTFAETYQWFYFSLNKTAHSICVVVSQLLNMFPHQRTLDITSLQWQLLLYV